MKRLIGIGNPDRGDDGVGWEVASRVRSWHTMTVTAGSFDLIDDWDADDEVVIVDAMRSGRATGATLRIDARANEVPTSAFASTHTFGPAEVVALAKAMGRLPRTLEVIGIEAGTVVHGSTMSSEVAAAATELVKELEHA